MDEVDEILAPIFIVGSAVYHLVKKEEGDKQKEFVSKRELVEFLKEVLDEQTTNEALEYALDLSLIRGICDDETKEIKYIPPYVIMRAFEDVYSVWKEKYLPRIKADRTPE